jgi:hypothetical protein
MGTARDQSFVSQTAWTVVDLRGDRQSRTEQYARADTKPEIFKVDVGRQVAEINAPADGASWALPCANPGGERFTACAAAITSTS